MSQRNVLHEEAEASYSFLDQVLRPDEDLAFVMQFDESTDLLQDFTASLPLLRKSLHGLEIPLHEGTKLFDTIFLASDELMSLQPGRKALILLTDGGDYRSSTSLAGCIKAAQKSGVAVYSILFTDPRFSSSNVRGRKILEQISRGTGGLFFEVSKKQSIRDIYARIQLELRRVTTR